MRVDLIDGMRGHLLVGMMLAHLGFQEGLDFLLKIHHARVLRVYDAEFFIIISGYLVGYLCARNIDKIGWFRRFVAHRLRIIYIYYLISSLPFLVLHFAQGTDTEWPLLIAQVLFLQKGGDYSDILPIYFYCFLVLSLFLVLAQGRMRFLVLASVALFLASQFSYQTGFLGLSRNLVVFDIAAWQILFVLPFVIGLSHARVAAIIAALSPAQVYALLAAGAMVLLADRTCACYVPLEAVPEGIKPNWVRMQLHPFFLLKIVAITTGIVLIIARRDRLTAWLHDLLRWYFSLRLLRNIGTYSIQMFTVHVFMLAFYKHYVAETEALDNTAVAILLILGFIALPNLWKLAQLAAAHRNLTTLWRPRTARSNSSSQRRQDGLRS